MNRIENLNGDEIESKLKQIKNWKKEKVLKIWTELKIWTKLKNVQNWKKDKVLKIKNMDKNGHNWYNCTILNESYKLKLILSKLKIQTFLAHSKTLCAYVTIIHKAINLSQKSYSWTSVDSRLDDGTLRLEWQHSPY